MPAQWGLFIRGELTDGIVPLLRSEWPFFMFVGDVFIHMRRSASVAYTARETTLARLLMWIMRVDSKIKMPEALKLPRMCYQSKFY